MLLIVVSIELHNWTNLKIEIEMIPFLFYEMRVGDRIKAGEVIHLMTIIGVCKQFDNIELDLSVIIV